MSHCSILKSAFVIVLAAATAMLAAEQPRAKAGGAGSDRGSRIRLEGHEFDPLAGLPTLPLNLRYEPPRLNEEAYHIVQFKDRILPQMRRDLERAGAVVLHFVHENAYLVRATGEAIGRARTLSSVRWTGLFEPGYKLGPRLATEHDDVLNRQIEEAARRRGRAAERIDTSSRLAVHILTVERDRVPEVARSVEDSGGSGVQITSGRVGLVRAEIPRSALQTLAREPGVLWIEREFPAETMNDVARWVIQSNDFETPAPVHARGVTGAGQIVTVTDTGLDTFHDAFTGKVTAYYTPSGATGDIQDNGTTQHGTHVSGSVAGDAGDPGEYDGDGIDSGNANGEMVQFHDGQAFGAQLQIQDVSTNGSNILPSSDLSTHYAGALSRGSWINTNSWGSASGLGGYGTGSLATDDFIWDNPQFTVLFAAGNLGPSIDTISRFATGKNLIAVGASGNGFSAGSPASFSSRGPTDDGRLKPDVMAPGVGLWSARGCKFVSPPCPTAEHDIYKELSGTSMATPTVAGAAALVRQYYMGGWYPTGDPASGAPFTPSAALIKATLINSAVEMTSPSAYGSQPRYPNNIQGWGRILLDNALYFPGDTRHLVAEDNAGVTVGQTHTYFFPAGNPLEPLEVTIVWSDRPRTSPTAPVLVNDLDLVVTSPTGTVYRGNVYDGFDPGESKAGATLAEADHLNNVESVLVISDLTPGAWTITVTGYNVPLGDAQGRQPYALVITGQANSSLGFVVLDRNEYTSSDTVTVRVQDTDLNQDPQVIETAGAQIASDTETLAESIVVVETSPDSGVFSGPVQLQGSATPIPGDGFLQVQNGDQITASYFDADDGAGGSGTRLAFATVDEDPPVISAVAASAQPRRATIAWSTDEPADSLVTYGISPPLTGAASDSQLATGHAVELLGLQPGVTYLYQVTSADGLGNARTDDNGGAYYAFTTPAPGPDTVPEWPTHQNAANRQGASPSMILPPVTPLWSVTNSAGYFRSGAVVSGGGVYTAEGGYVRARDASSGALVWERQLGNFQPSSTPAVWDYRVYVPVTTVVEDEYGIHEKGFVYALDAATGDTIWSYTSSDPDGIRTRFMIAVDNGRVIAQSSDWAVDAIDAGNGSFLWSHFQPGLFPTKGAAVGDGKVFVPHTGPGGTGFLMAIDEASGAQLWAHNVGSVQAGHVPLFAQGTVYVGTGLPNTPIPGVLLALSSANGSRRWEVAALNPIISTPAYDGTTIYFASSDSQGLVAFQAADATAGDLLWTRIVDTSYSYASASLAYADGHIYAVSHGGDLLVIDVDDGEIVQSLAIGEPIDNTHLAIAGSSIFVEGQYGTLFAFLAQEDPDDDHDGDPDVTDCAPLDPSRHHGAIEQCNNMDDDCSGLVDDLGTTTCGVGACQQTVENCIAGVPQTCTPGDPSPEVCNLIDDNCNGTIDEGFDSDGDGYTSCGGDCNDADPAIRPGATETCNLVDDNCNGYVDEGQAFDQDGDGWTSCGGDCADNDSRINGTERGGLGWQDISCSDGLDNDCDGTVDWECALVVGDEDLAQGTRTPPSGFGDVHPGSSDNTYVVYAETTPGKKLIEYWTVYLTGNNSPSTWYDLLMEAHRTPSNGNDTFSVSWAKRNQAGECTNTSGETYSPAFLVTRTSDPAGDPQLQAFQVGPPSFDTQAFCIKVVDTKPTQDNPTDSLRVDRLYLMPTLLHVRAVSEFTTAGTRLNGTSYFQTQNPDGVSEVIQESAGDTLNHTWKFNVPAGYSHQLHIEAWRTTGDPGDDFQFYYATPSAGDPNQPGTFQIIPGALVNIAHGGINADFPFGPTLTLKGSVWIRVLDTLTGSTPQKLNVDYLSIKSTP